MEYSIGPTKKLLFIIINGFNERCMPFPQEWKTCRAFCNPNGQNGLQSKIMKFDTRKVHLELMARCREVLDEYTMAEVQTVSAGAGTFYVWVSTLYNDNDGPQFIQFFFHETVVGLSFIIELSHSTNRPSHTSTRHACTHRSKHTFTHTNTHACMAYRHTCMHTNAHIYSHTRAIRPTCF